MSLKLLSRSKCFAGEQRIYSHFSKTLDCKMTLGVYIPPQVIYDQTKCPVLYFLSGFTCSHQNFIKKSGFQKYASEQGICVINPDTSPRGLEIPGEDVSPVFGTGAGFYVDATQEPWSKNYRMYSYVTQELIELAHNELPVIEDKQSIMGHSMGGHGALIVSLKNPGLYQSVSVFAPICNPIESALCQEVLKGYLGDDEEEWKKWDASELASIYADTQLEILIDQGTEDESLKDKHLLPEKLLSASANNDCIRIIYKERQGYDHSHFYVSTFVGYHLNYHTKFLKS